jgi:transcriptional regulator GlxA family with amidase domain
MTHRLGIYIFADVEVLDFAGPFEVFSTASRVKSRLQPQADRPFEVFTIADSLRPVKARGGLLVQPHFDIRNHPPIDILVIPGGVVTAELERATIIDWIKQVSARTKLTASVCTGAFLLAKAGLLQGKNVTTHWEDVDDLRSMFTGFTVKIDTRWVDEGAVVTSAGISAGLDMSLHIVERFEGEALALKTARQMDYDWHRSA